MPPTPTTCCHSDRSLVSGSIWMDEFLGGGRARREELATPQEWRRGDKEEEMVLAACVAVAGSPPRAVVGRLPATTSPSSCCPTSCCPIRGRGFWCLVVAYRNMVFLGQHHFGCQHAFPGF
ncbi:uncharacterized protein LOC124664803 [Lolium rigidum]|uniref:uncharacterized protein LOC124664803 n=1 Tax=Lolium rigidum TaxID=89674 RepID=UPI001F5C3D31|nr:uncharacterized protein LOC124664803 [Lolium rigidum]